MTIERIQVQDKPGQFNQLSEEFNAPGATTPVRFQRSDDGVTVQIAGNATTMTARVERATRDPNSALVDWAPVDIEPYTGSLIDGLPPRSYTEPGRGWWRVRLTAVAGGKAIVSIVGEPG